MKITTVGRQMEVTSDLKKLFEKKLKKFDKFFREEAEATVTVSRKRNFETIELMIESGGTLFRSEESNSTFQNALDKSIASIERQIRKNKTRLEKRLRDDAFASEQYDVINDEEEKEFDIRVKKFPIKPMSAEEAILQMNLLNHEFFAFRDASSDEINVVYKRKDGGYGMIVPS